MRAEVIKEYLHGIGTNECVCFTCGNAGKALREVGLDVITVGDNEDLKPQKFFSEEENIKTFKRFNATSGYLNFYLMNKIAHKMRIALGELQDDSYFVPTGSGETLLVLSLAYPDKKFFPIRFNNPETKYDEGNPLNGIIDFIERRNKECK
jgi:hypothetical protein